MRLVYGYALAVAAVMSAPNIIGAQQAETARSVAGGGITAAGWTGKVDANEEKNGQTVNNAKLAMEGKGLNDHPHPYGIVIGGNDLGTPTQSYLYCAAYGNGNFIVRGFGPEPFQVNGRRGEPNAAVAKAAGPGQSVKQDIAVSVKGDKVECSINGTVVGSYDKAAVVAAGKLKSTDGVYGIRFAHNTEAVVSGLTMTKN